MADRGAEQARERDKSPDAVPAVGPEPAALHLPVIRRYLGILSIIAGAVALYFAKQVVLPFILGMLIALTLTPVSRVLAKLGIPPVLSAFLLIGSLAIGAGGGGYLLSGPVSGWIEQVPRIRVKLEQRMEDVASSLRLVKEASEQVEKITEGAQDGTVLKVAIDQPGLLATTMADAAQMATTLLVALILALFLLASGDNFYIKLVESFSSFGEKKRALKIAYGVEESVSHYLLSVTLINAALGIVIGLGFWALGMPQPALWGTMAFLFNFLPYVGAAAGTVISAAIALVSFDTLGDALFIPGFYVLATSIEGYFITPVILGRRFELNAVFVFATVVFWGWMWGVAGALMAVPFLVCLKVLCDNVPSLSVLGNFLGNTGRAARFDPLREEPATPSPGT